MATLEEQLVAEREARLRAEARLEGYREAMADALALLQRDPVAERRRAYDRERKRRIPPDSGGTPVEVPSPLLEGSPLPSVPSLPPPISSPQPFFASQGEAPPPSRVQLVLEAQKPPKAGRKQAARREEPPGDPRHQGLVDRLTGAFREVTGKTYGFLPVDARKVKDLLALADQDPGTAGEAAPAEVERRWRLGLAWAWANGEQPVQTLTALVQRWNECREARGPPGKASTQRHVSASEANHQPAGVVHGF